MNEFHDGLQSMKEWKYELKKKIKSTCSVCIFELKNYRILHYKLINSVDKHCISFPLYSFKFDPDKIN